MISVKLILFKIVSIFLKYKMIKLEYLRVFVAVADAGELHTAAAQLGRTPAALSMTLKQLEESLGGSLFEGERKGHLTPLGTFALHQARPLVNQCDHVVADMRKFALGATGVVKVAAVPSAAALLMPAALKRFHTQRAEVRVELRDIDSSAVIQSVLNNVVDVGVASVVGSFSNLRVQHLLDDPFVWVCKRNHPLSQLRRAVRWRDINPSDFIANGLCAGLHVPELDHLVQHAKLMLLSTTSLLSFVRADMGVTLLPALSVPLGDDLLALPVAHKGLNRRLDLITVDNVSLLPAAEALIQHITIEAEIWTSKLLQP